jgi:xanthine/uracil permease
MSGILWIYRLVYILILVTIGANVIKAFRAAFGGEMAGLLACVVVCIALIAAVLTSGFMRRFSIGFMWAVTLVWCATFSWYAWFFSSSRFLPHEVHTFNPVEAAASELRFKEIAVIIFVLLVVWFLNFPVVQGYQQRSQSIR